MHEYSWFAQLGLETVALAPNAASNFWTAS